MINFADFVKLDPASPTGLVWLPRPRERFLANKSYHRFTNNLVGQPAGYVHKDQNGYVSWKIEIESRPFMVSRIVYELFSGKPVPKDMIVDHADRDGLNNAYLNLRLANKTQNKQNSKIRKDNQAGFKGVHKAARCARWVARIGRSGNTFLGSFKSPEEAHAAYAAAAKKMHKEFHCLK